MLDSCNISLSHCYIMHDVLKRTVSWTAIDYKQITYAYAADARAVWFNKFVSGWKMFGPFESTDHKVENMNDFT